MVVIVKPFGEVRPKHDEIKKISRFILANESLVLHVINYGATITSLKVKDKLGISTDVVLGFDNIAGN